MLSGKLLKRVQIVFVYTAFVNMMLGCSNNPTDYQSSVETVSDDQTQSNEVVNSEPSYQVNAVNFEERFVLGQGSATDGETKPEDIFVDEISRQSFELGNGVQVTINSVVQSELGIDMILTYAKTGVADTRRQMRIKPSLRHATIHSMGGDELYGWETAIAPTGDFAICRIWTDQDRLEVTTYESWLHNIYNVNGQIAEVKFSSVDERERAFEIFNAATNDHSLLSNESDSALLATMKAAADLLVGATTFQNNLDAEVMSYLLGDEEFVTWVRQHTDMAPLDHVACDIASLVAVATCWCFATGWCALLCVPATGVSVACAIAGVASALAK